MGGQLDLGRVIAQASTSNPLMDGTSSPGSAIPYAREDHVHPIDTSRASVSELATYVRPNLLDNWYFVGGGSQQGGGQFPINQREQSVYTGNVYVIDRWSIANNSTLTVNSGYVTFAGTGSGAHLISQVIEGNALYGKQLTFSMLETSGNFVTHTFNSPNSGSRYTKTGLAIGSETFNFIFNNEGGSNSQLMIAKTNENITLNLVAVKLELGSSQTLAHNEGTTENPVWVLNEIPNYEEQFIRCKSSTADTSDTYANDTAVFWNDIHQLTTTTVVAFDFTANAEGYQITSPGTGYAAVGAYISRLYNLNAALILFFRNDNFSNGWRLEICQSGGATTRARGEVTIIWIKIG